MTPDEVINSLKTYGIDVTRRTLLRYEKNSLIPEPKRGGDGRGKGRFTDYPPNTPACFYAAYSLLHNCISSEFALPMQIIKKGRLLAEGEESARGLPHQVYVNETEAYAYWNFFLELYNREIIYSKQNTYTAFRIECNSSTSDEKVIELFYSLESKGMFNNDNPDGFGGNLGQAKYTFLGNYLNKKVVFVVERDLETRKYKIVAKYHLELAKQ